MKEIITEQWLTVEQAEKIISLLQGARKVKRTTTVVYKGDEQVMNWLERTIKREAVRLARKILADPCTTEADLENILRRKRFINDSWTDYFNGTHIAWPNTEPPL